MNNTIKQSLRYFRNNKLFTFVNVFGLSVSFVLIFLLFAYITNEKNTDRFHKNSSRIYRVTRAGECAFSPPFGQYIKDNIDGVEAFCRVFTLEANLRSEYNLVKCPSCFYVDSNFFEMFSFPLITGNPENVLATRNNIILSESFAKKMFPGTDPIGKTIKLNNRLNYTVSGIIRDFDETTHFKRADVIMSMDALSDFFGNPQYLSQYEMHYFLPGLYLLAKENVKLEDKGNVLYDKAKKWYWLFQQDESSNIVFQPLTEAYFNPVKYGFPMGEREGNRKLLFLFTWIVIGILFIALLNFVNLSLTCSFNRHSEFGIKKIVGAGKSHAILQSFTETAFIFLISGTLAFLFVQFLLPSFNLLTSYHTNFIKWFHLIPWQEISVYILIIYLLSSIIPALIVSRFSPATVIYKRLGINPVHFWQQALVVFQFTIATILIASMLVIQKQSNFLLNYNTGFNKSETVYICLNSQIKNKKLEYKEELSKISGVEGVSLCNGMPGVGIPSLSFEAFNKTQDIDYFNIDNDYFSVMQIKRFNPTLPDWNSCWINESAAKSLNYKSEDKTIVINWNGNKVTYLVNEILPDMNFHSLYEPCKPTILTKLDTQGWVDYALLRVNMVDVKNILMEVQKIHNKFSPDFPFDYAFLNETINKAYTKEIQISKIIFWFSLFSVVISAMGLFAFSFFLINSKKKEIGIRKVVGAKTFDVVAMINKQIIKWVTISLIIATPIAWYTMFRWLQNFAYKASLSWWIFTLAGFIVLSIALLTVNWQSWRAATRNPVEALRYE